jgi:hypothetical protein
MGEFTNRRRPYMDSKSVQFLQFECHETEDFNYGGRQTDVAAKLKEIREKLIEFGVIAGR